MLLFICKKNIMRSISQNVKKTYFTLRKKKLCKKKNKKKNSKD